MSCTSQVRLWKHRRRVLLGVVWEMAGTHRQVRAVSCNSMQVFLVSAEVLKMSPRLIRARVSIYAMWGFPDLCFAASSSPSVVEKKRNKKNQVRLCADTLMKLKLFYGPICKVC